MSLKFLNLKSFHPSNKQNQKLLYLAEEEHQNRTVEEARAAKEFLEEQELFKEKLTREESRQRTQLNAENYRKKLEREKLEEETKNLNPEFKPTKKKRRAKKNKDDISQPLSFMYTLPPGLKALQEKEEKERLTKEADEIAPKMEERQEDKFDVLKNAPTEGNFDKKTSDVKLVYKPFAVELRNVKCTKCGNMGHASGDRECPLLNHYPLDQKRIEMEDPMLQIKRIQGGSLNIKGVTPNFEPNELIPSDPEDEKLSKEERKRLKKEYKELKKQIKRKRKEEKQESVKFKKL